MTILFNKTEEGIDPVNLSDDDETLVYDVGDITNVEDCCEECVTVYTTTGWYFTLSKDELLRLSTRPS